MVEVESVGDLVRVVLRSDQLTASLLDHGACIEDVGVVDAGDEHTHGDSLPVRTSTWTDQRVRL